ncbi:ClC family H(+)/Cl(-) exchange transporter [Pseudoclavibacter helvolus]|uniref:ClC family H(+)/Cl(-) exchange transporter n=1 Tax=Pseudoclavibacter helvolus TaxID=255205 RepID=UPI003C73047B
MTSFRSPPPELDPARPLPGGVVLCLLAVIAGAATGFVAGAFRWCLERISEWRAELLIWAERLDGPGWLIPVVVAAAGAALAASIVGLVPRAVGSGIQDVEAVDRGDLAAPPLRVLPAKFVGGLLALGSGLVLGREGPSVHMGAALGAEAGRRARRSDAEVRVLQTSLAGAGLAVAFTAPIGGALFVFEEVAKSFWPKVVLPTLLGVAAAVSCSRLILDDRPDFDVRDVAVPGFELLPAFVVFGVLTGLLGALYNVFVIRALTLADRAARVPQVVKAAAVGALVGLALVLAPLTAGGGDELSQLLLGGSTLAVPLLLVYLAIRFVAGPLSYAAGTPGGLFAPLLAVGALWGALFARLVDAVLPGHEVGVAMAIVGMAAFFAATVRAPLTGVVLVVEMTTITSVAVPMLAAAGAAVLTATLVRSAPIYDTLRERMLQHSGGSGPSTA